MLLEPTFIACAVVATMKMRCQGHVAHGTSSLYSSVRSLRDLNNLRPSALGCVNSVETCTSVYNLYLSIFGSNVVEAHYYGFRIKFIDTGELSLKVLKK